jgi:hypothetical protein
MFPRFTIEIFRIALLILFVCLFIKFFKNEEYTSFNIAIREQNAVSKAPTPTLYDIIP